MKKGSWFVRVLVLLSIFLMPSVYADQNNNDFYDDGPTYILAQNSIVVDGEIVNPGEIDFSHLPLRSVIVKETKLKEKEPDFVGAYLYQGYSLYDILNNRKIQKNNQNEFKQIIDLYVEIKSDSGESVFLTWGEIYYPFNRHQIIIATKVTPIIPKQGNQQWPIPQRIKLVVAPDLISERNISSPVRITVKSLDVDLDIDPNAPLYSPKISVYNERVKRLQIDEYPNYLEKYIYPTVFYGRGMGIHGVTPFYGAPLRYILKPYFPITKANLRRGIFVIAAVDGYRGAFSFSELFNHNDQSEILLIDRGEDPKGGKFSLFVSADYFSDRAIKAICDIYYSKVENWK